MAMLDVPRHVVDQLSRLLAGHRRRIGTPKGSRALGPSAPGGVGAALVPRTRLRALPGPGSGVSQATGYRYLHEGIDILADQTPDLHEVLDRCRREGMSHVVLDGTLIESDRVAGVRENGNDLWFSQKHKAFGGNVQFLSAPDGTPLWSPTSSPAPLPTSPPPGSTHFPPSTTAADGLPTLADKGYIDAGIGIHVPVRRPKGRSERALHADTQTTNSLVRHPMA
ncbi:IS5/IS1182 family transposase [Streptomyces sp. NPDC058864]